MGLFNDYRGTSREGWKYNYTGEELLIPAQRKYKEVKSKELEARNKVAELLRDASVSPNDKRLEDGKRDIERYGNESEQCMVFVHEFARKPTREYNLSLGDVTYFDLANTQ